MANDLRCNVSLVGLHSYGTQAVVSGDSTLEVVNHVIRLEGRFEAGGETHAHVASFSPYFRSRIRQWLRTWTALSGCSRPLPVARRDVTWVNLDELSAALADLHVPLNSQDVATSCLVLAPSWPADLAWAVLFWNESDARQATQAVDELFSSGVSVGEQ